MLSLLITLSVFYYITFNSICNFKIAFLYWKAHVQQLIWKEENEHNERERALFELNWKRKVSLLNFLHLCTKSIFLNRFCFFIYNYFIFISWKIDLHLSNRGRGGSEPRLELFFRLEVNKLKARARSSLILKSSIELFLTKITLKIKKFSPLCHKLLGSTRLDCIFWYFDRLDQVRARLGLEKVGLDPPLNRGA
jgi:hypothetical protein